MSHVSEPQELVVPANVQDVFLNGARRDRLMVSVQLLDGRIKSFDRFAVIVEVSGADQLVFKHAIASIGSGRTLSSYAADRS
jgi:host factor-I protein